MATGTVQAPQGDPVTNLINLLGGQAGTQTVTQSPANIAGLQQLQQQLQGADYNALLQSIFQQAAGAIPGLQSAYGRAVGARTARNSATQAALSELLKQTTVAAQEKIANQQLQNQQIQAQAGQAVAQATKGTTQTTKEKSGTNLQKAAAILGLLQAATKLTGSNTVQDMLGKISGSSTAPAAQPTVAQATAATPAARTISSAPAAVAPAAAATMAPVVDRSSAFVPDLAPVVNLDIPQLVQTPYTAPMQGQIPDFDIYDIPAEVPMTPITFPVMNQPYIPEPNLINGIDIMNYGL